MTALHRRLLALETTTDPQAKPLPTVVPDDTPADELERLRRGGREVYRLSDAVELFV
ncbi:MAG: hypothetical protein I8H67_09025 [Comamonadaceae bacterium]|nr:hypothetical protein [Comamonadaceae bacterium]